MIPVWVEQSFALMPAALSFAILSCDSDDVKAFLSALYLDNRKQLLSYASRLCGNRQDAEDAVQDAFLSLIPRAKELQTMHEDRLKGYLYITVKNAAWMNYRKEQRMARSETRSLSAGEGELNGLPTCGYTFEDLMEALPRLSERDQLLLEMKYFLRESDQAIALRLNVQAGSVKKLVGRARKRLVKMLEEGSGSDHGEFRLE